MENPVPLTFAELTVTAAVPVELRRTDWAMVVFKESEPNAIEVAFMLRRPVLAAVGERETVNDFEMPASVAVMTAV